MKISAHFLRTNTFAPIIILSFFLLSACGGGGGSSDPSALNTTSALSTNGDDSTSFSLDQLNTPVDLNGGGIKGPLAHATVNIYKLDNNFPDFFDPSQPIATGITDANAAIQNLSLPAGTELPLILEVDGTNSTDLITNKTPVLTKLRTVVTKQQIEAGTPIYATPLSTLTFHVAKFATHNSHNTDSLLNQLTNANNLVLSVFNFGLTSNFSTFLTSPLLDSNSTTVAQQQLAAEYRAANEALATIIFLAANELRTNGIDASENSVLLQLARDLAADKKIDNRANNRELDFELDLGILSENVLDLTIPNSSIMIRDIAKILEDELQLGNSSAIFLIPNYTPPIRKALLNADLDNDGLLNVFDPISNILENQGTDQPINWENILRANTNNTFYVSTQSEFNIASNSAQPGDIIAIKSGTYSWNNLRISSNGTEEAPIIYTSEEPLATKFVGSRRLFNITGNHNIIGGFIIEDVEEHTFHLNGASNNRITGNSIINAGTAGGFAGHIEITSRSNHNQFDHNVFDNQIRQIRIFLNDDAVENGPSQYNRFNHNIFKNSREKSKSVIQIGQGPQSHINSHLLEARTIFEHNLIENYLQDDSLIQVKSSSNIIRYNEIRDSNGGLYQRNGNNNEWYNNFIHGSGSGNAITLHGANHQVYNNVINVTGKLGLYMTRSGDRPSQGTSQNGVVNAIPPTHNNTVRDNYILGYGQTNGFSDSYGMLIGVVNSEASEAISDNNIHDNVIMGTTGQLLRYEPTSYGSISVSEDNTRNTFNMNSYYPSGSAILGSGFTHDQNAITVPRDFTREIENILSRIQTP